MPIYKKDQSSGVTYSNKYRSEYEDEYIANNYDKNPPAGDGSIQDIYGYYYRNPNNVKGETDYSTAPQHIGFDKASGKVKITYIEHDQFHNATFQQVRNLLGSFIAHYERGIANGNELPSAYDTLKQLEFMYFASRDDFADPEAIRRVEELQALSSLVDLEAMLADRMGRDFDSDKALKDQPLDDEDFEFDFSDELSEEDIAHIRKGGWVTGNDNSLDNSNIVSKPIGKVRKTRSDKGKKRYKGKGELRRKIDEYNKENAKAAKELKRAKDKAAKAKPTKKAKTKVKPDMSFKLNNSNFTQEEAKAAFRKLGVKAHHNARQIHDTATIRAGISGRTITEETAILKYRQKAAIKRLSKKYGEDNLTRVINSRRRIERIKRLYGSLKAPRKPNISGGGKSAPIIRGNTVVKHNPNKRVIKHNKKKTKHDKNSISNVIFKDLDDNKGDKDV